MSVLPGKAKRARWIALLTGMSVLHNGLTNSCSGQEAAKARDVPAAAAGATKPEPPVPSYPHGKVRRFDLGEGPRSYWIFEPADPRPDRAPLVVFLHGWFAVNPAFYGAWIEHLVRSGQIVVFPRYQNDVGTLPKEFLPNAMAAIRDALEVLETGAKHVRPDLSRFVLIGHSAGGNLAAQIAAVSSDPHAGLPLARLVITLMPGEVIPSREPRLESIPASTLLLVAVGEDDLLVGDLRGRQIFTQTTSIPRSRKRYMLFRSDRHGFPPIVAEHTAPTGANRTLDTGEGILRSFQMSLGEVNAMDRAGFWRVSDAAIEAAFAGRTFDEAILDPGQFTHLGYWSDGRKVVPPLIADDLSAIPRVTLPNGIRLIPWDAPTRVGQVPGSETRAR
jgi:acetyl esterase/lipase